MLLTTLTMTAISNSGVSVTVVLVSIICVGLAVMFVGGWYFQSSLVELKVQQQQLEGVVDSQNKQIAELQLQLQQVNYSLNNY